jgi:hypothetical protein
MTDILERLRDPKCAEYVWNIRQEAADEIERLRAAGRTANRILADAQAATADAVANERAAVRQLIERERRDAIAKRRKADEVALNSYFTGAVDYLGAVAEAIEERGDR